MTPLLAALHAARTRRPRITITRAPASPLTGQGGGAFLRSRPLDHNNRARLL